MFTVIACTNMHKPQATTNNNSDDDDENSNESNKGNVVIGPKKIQLVFIVLVCSG